MASKKVAVRPDFFSSIPSMKRDEELTEKGVTDAEKFLYAMSQTSGFVEFTRLKDELLKSMESYQESAIANGAGKEEIGENAILISMVKGVINRLWNFTEDAKEACESGSGE